MPFKVSLDPTCLSTTNAQWMHMRLQECAKYTHDETINDVIYADHINEPC
jgi:hypothetical protein